MSPFLVYVSSLLSLIVLVCWRGYKIIEFPWIYIGFTCIYTLAPYLYLGGQNELGIELSLLSLGNLNQLLLWVTAFNLGLLWVFYGAKNFKLNFIAARELSISSTPITFFVLLPFSFVASSLYPWPTFDVPLEFGHTVAAWLKIFVLVSFARLCLNANPKLSLWAAILVILLCIIDRARTSLFHAVFIYLIAARKPSFFSNRFFKILCLSGMIFIFLAVTLGRNNVEFSFANLAYPFVTEGIFGSYSSLQTLEMIDANQMPVSYAVSVLIDFGFKFLPFDLVSSLAEIINVSDTATFWNTQNVLVENYAFLGGHFFPAEFIASFYYLAPFFFMAYVYSYFKFCKALPASLFVMVYACSFLIIKATILVTVKYIVAIVIVFYAIFFMEKYIFSFKIKLSQGKFS